MTAALIETRRLVRRFGGVAAVDGVDFELHEGELRCLLGPNGAGKSTFFKMLSGQLRPTSGAILLRGEEVSGLAAHEIARRRVGIKNQVPQLFEGLDTYENLWVAARAGRHTRAIDAVADETMDLFALQPWRSTLARELAHGVRQRVEIAAVFAADPDILLLDEPAAGLTANEASDLAAALKEVNRHKTIVVVEHNMAFVREIARRVTVFHRGAVLAEGDYASIADDPLVQDVYLGKAAAGC